jgi:penicillin-binding protein 2
LAFTSEEPPLRRAGLYLDPNVKRNRAHGLSFAFVLLLLLVVGRLLWLQVLRNESYSALSKDNYVQAFRIRPPRGMILDRNGNVLAANRVTFSLMLASRGSADTTLLGSVLGIDSSEMGSYLESAKQYPMGTLRLIDDLDLDRACVLAERRSELHGIRIRDEAKRSYPFGSLAAHAIGIVGEVTREEVRSGVVPGDIVGKGGVEKAYDWALSGTAGIEYLIYDAKGREVEHLSEDHRVSPVSGTSVIMTIDLPTQEAAESALREFDAGAVVAIDPTNGHVLAMASLPDFDPNMFTSKMPEAKWRRLRDSEEHPFLNRAIQATYPPGSVFKIVSGALALRDGIVSPNQPVYCTGSYTFGNRSFGCWKTEGHGWVDFLEAIERSCDSYFYWISESMSVEELAMMAREFGLGRQTGIDMPGESMGLVPDSEWYDENYGKGKWTRGVTLNLGIGQGELLVTPLQLACAMSVIANRGTSYVPRIVKALTDEDGEVVQRSQKRILTRVELDASYYDVLERSLELVVSSPIGTGRLAAIDGIRFAGKTGTAQNPRGEDHGWFVGYAPVGSPKIVIAVVAEHAGHGSTSAAPIAAKVVSAYLGVKPVAVQDMVEAE